MIAVITNAVAVLIGSLVGLLFKKGIPERISGFIMKCIGLCVFYVAVTGMFEDEANALIVIISVALGAAIGELIDIDKYINLGAEKVASRFVKGGDAGKVAEGFVSASLLFCIGAMTVVGSIQAGVSHDYTTLFTKSLIDCISAVIFASTLGFGVCFSSVSVFVVQGAICIAAVFVAPFLSDFMIANLNVVGSIAILAISLNLAGITKIKVANILPALLFPLALCPLFNLFM